MLLLEVKGMWSLPHMHLQLPGGSPPDEESEGPSHAPESAMAAASRRQDANNGSDSSDFVVASPPDSMASVPVKPDDAMGIGI